MLSKIKEDLKQGMLSRDETTVLTLRMLLSELNNFKINKGAELEDADIISIVQKEVKKRREASIAFKSGGRDESAQKEDEEAKILEQYLPTQVSEEELSAIVNSAITEVSASNMSDMGKVMAIVKVKVGATADPGRISQMVKEGLNG